MRLGPVALLPVAGNDGFLDHLPALIAAALAAVGVSIGLSYFGWAGTLIGLTLGTLVTGTVAWYVEKLIRRLSARTKALAEARKRKGAPLSETETSMISAVADEHVKRRYRRPPWQAIALGLSVVFVAAGALLVVIALSAGLPVGAIVHNTPPSHTPTVVPTVVPTSSVPTFSASPSPTFAPSPSLPATTTPPSPSPSPTGSSPAPSPTSFTVPTAAASPTF